jgi:ribosomal-protein-alanine N-acetyltransferase
MIDKTWRDGLPAIVGSRVLLREPQFEDAASLVEALSNGEVARFMTPPPSTVAGFKGFIAWVQSARAAGRCICQAIVIKETGRAVGLIQLRALEHDYHTSEWGFALGPAHWGSGVFMEGAQMLLDFAFRHLHVHRLEARASVENGRGNSVLAKLGATREGTLRRSLEQGGARVDQSLWALLAGDWARRLGVEYELAPMVPVHGVDHGDVTGRSATAPAWCDALPELQGRLGTLRELRAGDHVELLSLLGDADVRRYTFPPPETPEQFEGFRRWSQSARRAGRYACFGIVPGGQEYPAGLIQLRALEPSFRTAEWGFVLGRPYWGNGLFREMATLLVDFAIDTIGVLRLEARSAVANTRACHVLKRLGAVCEGSLRKSFLVGDTYLDDALYSLLADDWRRMRELRASPGLTASPGGDAQVLAGFSRASGF